MAVLLVMILGAGVALFFPEWVLWMKGGLRPAFAVTMFFVGTLVKKQEIDAFMAAPHRPLIGLVGQYTIMPVSAFVVSLFFDDPMVRAGVVLVGCMPGAMASNVMTVLLKGDLVMSVIMTTLATLVSPLVIGFWLPLLTDTRVSLPIGSMVWDATWMVALPVLFGAMLRNRVTQMPRFWDRIATGTAASAIVMIILVVAAANRERLLEMGPGLTAGMIALNLGAYAVAFVVGRLLQWPPKQRRTFIIEVGMQNAGLGSVLALAHLGPAGAVPSAFYTGLCVMTAAMALPLLKIWERRK